MMPEETLAEITMTLVEADRNALFVERLLAMDQGEWEDPALLCAGLPDEGRLAAVRETFAGDLKVTWLDYPYSSHGPGCCTILFYSRERDWSNLVFFHKDEFFVERALTEIAADLVGQKKGVSFLERLFAMESGRWEELAVLCVDLPEILARLAGLDEQYIGDLRATWLEYPTSSHGSGYCLIFLFSDTMWNHVASFNRGLFLKESSARCR
jgi:hypothetical protein